MTPEDLKNGCRSQNADRVEKVGRAGQFNGVFRRRMGVKWQFLGGKCWSGGEYFLWAASRLNGSLDEERINAIASALMMSVAAGLNGSLDEERINAVSRVRLYHVNGRA